MDLFAALANPASGADLYAYEPGQLVFFFACADAAPVSCRVEHCCHLPAPCQVSLLSLCRGTMPVKCHGVSDKTRQKNLS